MVIITQIGIIFLICLIAQLIASILPIPFPSSVIGMILLLVLLLLKILKPEHIENKIDFLLKNMAFFFIPAGVNIMNNYDFIKGSILPLLIICLITTVLTFITTAWTVKFIINFQLKLKEKHK